MKKYMYKKQAKKLPAATFNHHLIWSKRDGMPLLGKILDIRYQLWKINSISWRIAVTCLTTLVNCDCIPNENMLLVSWTLLSYGGVGLTLLDSARQMFAGNTTDTVANQNDDGRRDLRNVNVRTLLTCAIKNNFSEYNSLL